ncbi:gamma-glutamylcyclotransferase family protein [Salinisphaera orenii]|uniref:gamma-glutamylcyclotransferase family protein n=1 Tax=Salinisphaera orenii TaxID=856731 RepID=UPI000DBE7B7A
MMSLTTAAETSHLRAGHPASYFRLRHAPADGANYELLNHAVHRASIATPAAYTLYDAGAFPVAVTGGATALVGNVFDVEAATFVRVDALENRPVDYDQFVITTAAGSIWLYRWQRALDPVWPRIESGIGYVAGVPMSVDPGVLSHHDRCELGVSRYLGGVLVSGCALLADASCRRQ